MMHRTFLIAMAALCAAAFAAEEHPDWSALSGEVTIAAGVTNLAEEADMPYVNALTKITFGSATAAIRFTGETPPAIPFSGSGAIIKDSDYDWTLTVAASSNFKGNYILKGGIVTPMVVAAFGSFDDNGATLWIENGATMKFVNEMKKKNLLWKTPIHISGSGKNGKGAIWVCTYQNTGTSDIKNIILEDDAEIFADGSSCYYYHCGTLSMKGHKLTVTGSGDYYFSNATISGGGELCVPESSTAGAGRALCIRAVVNFNVVDGVRTKISAGNNVTLDYREGSTGKENMSVQQYALEVNGLVTVWHNHQFAPYPFGEYDKHGLTLAGPITVKGASSTLKLYLSAADNCHLTVSGAIGGEGNVLVSGYSRVYLANPANTFEGSLTVNGASGASLRLAAPGSAPNYAAVTSTTARIALDVKSDCSAWTPAKIVEFADAVTLKKNAFISLDASQSENAAYTLSGDDWAQVADSVRYLSSDGTGTVSVTTSSLDDRRYAFGAVDGTLRFTGTAPLLVTNLFAAGSTTAHSQEVGTLVFDGAKSVNTTNSFITLGNQHWNTTYADKPGYMVVTNSFLACTRATNYTAVTSHGGTFPGWYGVGSLTIEPDSVITSNFVLAYGDTKSRGSVFQRGGDVAFLGASHSSYKGKTGLIGNTGYGYYELSGGNLDLIGRTCIASDSGQGILAIHGGTATVRQHYIPGFHDPWLVLANSGNGHLYMKGGELSITKLNDGGHYLIVGYSTSFVATLTLDGPNAHYLNTGACIVGYQKNGTFHINLNAGLMDVANITYKGGSYTKNTTYMNFNGGTYKARHSLSVIASSLATTNLAVYTLYPGGAYIDTNGKSPTINTSIIEAKGNGIVSVPLPEGLAQKELIGSPVVTISGGGGSFAQAYADYDSKARRVTGAHVICPGYGYTEAPTATFTMKGVSLGTSTCTLGANTPGDFVKFGSGTLTLSATNDYSGVTYVKGGTLKAGIDYGISTNSPIVLMNGAKLDFDSKRGSIKSIAYGAGGGSVINASNAELPASFSMEISVEDLMANKSVPLSGAVDLTGKELKLLGDTDALATGSAIRYTAVTGTAFTGTPTLTGEALPAKWEMRVTPTAVQFVRIRGTAFILR